MKQLIARLKYFFIGKHDPMDLLDHLPKFLAVNRCVFGRRIGVVRGV